MKIFMFVRCSNDASVPLEIELDWEVEFLCPFHEEDSKYCDFKDVCRFKGKFFAIPWYEEGRPFTPLTFSGKRIRGDEEVKWQCPAVRQDQFFNDMVETIKPETVIIVGGDVNVSRTLQAEKSR